MDHREDDVQQLFVGQFRVVEDKIVERRVVDIAVEVVIREVGSATIDIFVVRPGGGFIDMSPGGCLRCSRHSELARAVPRASGPTFAQGQLQGEPDGCGRAVNRRWIAAAAGRYRPRERE